MATSLHNVRRNFEYQLEQISPTCALIGRGFRAADRLRLDTDGNTTGRARDFVVRWTGSAEDRSPTDMYRREAEHDFEVRVTYPTAIGLEADVMDVILQDRHDIAERLRDSQYFAGYAGSASTSVGLLRRERMSDELDDTGPVWVVTTRFRCLVREDV